MLGVARPVAERQQRAVKGVGIEIEQADLLDQATRFDQAAGAGFAFGGPEWASCSASGAFCCSCARRRSASERAIRVLPLCCCPPWCAGREGNRRVGTFRTRILLARSLTIAGMKLLFLNGKIVARLLLYLSGRGCDHFIHSERSHPKQEFLSALSQSDCSVRHR